MSKNKSLYLVASNANGISSQIFTDDFEYTRLLRDHYEFSLCFWVLRKSNHPTIHFAFTFPSETWLHHRLNTNWKLCLLPLCSFSLFTILSVLTSTHSKRTPKTLLLSVIAFYIDISSNHFYLSQRMCVCETVWFVSLLVVMNEALFSLTFRTTYLHPLKILAAIV